MSAETTEAELPMLRIERNERVEQDGTVELHLIGEMDLSTRGRLEAALTVPDLDGAAGVHLDLRRLDFCDASGVADMIAARTLLAGTNRTFATSGSRSHMRRLLDITGTTDVLAPRGLETVPTD